MNKKDKTKLYKQYSKELQAILNAWDPLGVCIDGDGPIDEYECFVAPIVHVLEENKGEKVLVDTIKDHLEEHVGLSKGAGIDKDLIEKILNWWEQKNTDDNEMAFVKEHESGVRSILSLSKGISYSPLKSFEEAKEYEDAYLVMEGDWGGQIYLVVPVRLIMCSSERLHDLLVEIDKTQWDEAEGTGLYFERMKSGSGVWGGMGGGRATNALWVHERLEGIKNKIQDVIDNKIKPIN